MTETDYIQFLKDTLTEQEISYLNDCLYTNNRETRILITKSFFSLKDIFDKIKPVFDPMWVANSLITKGYGYQIR